MKRTDLLRAAGLGVLLLILLLLLFPLDSWHWCGCVSSGSSHYFHHFKCHPHARHQQIQGLPDHMVTHDFSSAALALLLRLRWLVTMLWLDV